MDRYMGNPEDLVIFKMAIAIERRQGGQSGGQRIDGFGRRQLHLRKVSLEGNRYGIVYRICSMAGKVGYAKILLILSRSYNETN